MLVSFQNGQRKGEIATVRQSKGFLGEEHVGAKERKWVQSCLWEGEEYMPIGQDSIRSELNSVWFLWVPSGIPQASSCRL